MVLCKACVAVNGELKCVVFYFILFLNFFLCIVNLRGGVMNTVYAIYLDSGIYITNCNLVLGFFLKFNVALGVYVV